jgi:molecular chaperone DnaJ
MVGKRDHYEVLGVSRNESSEGIRRAFRKRAKDCHPDHAGPDGEITFKELAEAHDVLSDPKLRRQYDRELDGELGEENDETSWPEAEPMSPGSKRPSWTSWAGVPLRDVPLHGWQQPEEQAEPEDVIEVELVLSPAEALVGGQLPLHLTLAVTCPACGGVGVLQAMLTPCSVCHGVGHVDEGLTAELTFPPGVSHGAVLRARAYSETTSESVLLAVTIRISLSR